MFNQTILILLLTILVIVSKANSENACIREIKRCDFMTKEGFEIEGFNFPSNSTKIYSELSKYLTDNIPICLNNNREVKCDTCLSVHFLHKHLVRRHHATLRKATKSHYLQPHKIVSLLAIVLWMGSTFLVSAFHRFKMGSSMIPISMFVTPTLIFGLLALVDWVFFLMYIGDSED